MISFVTVTYNSRRVIGDALRSIAEYCRDLDYEHIVVDNCSTDGTAALIRAEFPWVRLVESAVNGGFAKGNNLAFALARGETICLINPDLRLCGPIDLEGITTVLARPECGMVAGRLLYPDGRTQESLRQFPDAIVLMFRGFGLSRLFKGWSRYRSYVMADIDYDVPQRVDWAIGAFLFIRADLINRLGGFDESYFMYYEDADLAWRMSLIDRQVLYEPSLRAFHLYNRESAKGMFSRLKFVHVRSIVRFLMTKAGLRRSKGRAATFGVL